MIAWVILNTDLDRPQQTAAIILQLGGAAREMARHMTFTKMTQGGIINGQQVDAVTYLIANLAEQFAPLGEEQRLRAMTELILFQRQTNESTDTLLSRYMTLRFRASQGGVGMTMPWEGHSWLFHKGITLQPKPFVRVAPAFPRRMAQLGGRVQHNNNADPTDGTHLGRGARQCEPTIAPTAFG